MSTPPPPTTNPPTIFPTYLLPSLSFLNRRRKSSSSTTTSTTSNLSTTTSSSSSQTLPQPHLHGHTSQITCSRCHAHLALTSQIISKGFTGRHGRAYLVSSSPSANNLPQQAPYPTFGLGSNIHTLLLPNTNTHKPVPRHLVTGLHTVSDISCALCGTVLGWKYVSAEDEAQRYKVGKFILETRRIVVGSCWENEGGADGDFWGGEAEMPPVRGEEVLSGDGGPGKEEVMFDSQDEDECEDLFMGVWSPQLAKRRRARRVGGEEVREGRVTAARW